MDSITEPGTFGLLLTWHQLDLERPYYQDRLSHEHLVLKEEHLGATTVGNFAPFLIHRLTVDKTGEKPTLHLAPCSQIPDGCVPKGLTTLKGHPAIEPLPDNYPLYFIKTYSTLMTGHNDIFNPEVRPSSSRLSMMSSAAASGGGTPDLLPESENPQRPPCCPGRKNSIVAFESSTRSTWSIDKAEHANRHWYARGSTRC